MPRSFATIDRNRPVYAAVFIDAMHVKIRDGQVANRPIYAAIGVTLEGRRDVLGLWAGQGGEGAKFWMQVLVDLKNRGLSDVFFVVCDGLKGLPEVVGNVWPAAIVQTCVVHYSEIVVMPMWGRRLLLGAGARGGDVGIIRGLRGRQRVGQVRGSGQVSCSVGWFGRGRVPSRRGRLAGRSGWCSRFRGRAKVR